MSWKPRVMVLGPGGVKGFLLLGCLMRLFQNDYLDQVNHWVGVSAGAAISLLIVAGYNIGEIIEMCLEIDLIEDVLAINLDQAGQKLGLLQNKTVETKIKTSLESRYNHVPTLKELFTRTNIDLTLVTFNIDTVEPVFLNHKTHPNLSALEAAMMSMAVPFLIQPRKYNGQTYIDGAVGAPYPVTRYDREGVNVLGLYISSESDLYSSQKKPSSFVYKIIQASIKMLREVEIEHCSERVKHIGLKTEVRDTTGISLDRNAKQSMIDSGYRCGERFMTRIPYQIDIADGEEFSFEE